MNLCPNCHPVYGDKIIGEFKKDIFSDKTAVDEITIHRQVCKLCKKVQKKNKIELK
jgi:(p)ppGpp synthase/HD superfamily hydrolase